MNPSTLSTMDEANVPPPLPACEDGVGGLSMSDRIETDVSYKRGIVR